MKNMIILATLPTLPNKAGRSSFIPLTTKKKGTNAPKAIAVSFESKMRASRSPNT